MTRIVHRAGNKLLGYLPKNPLFRLLTINGLIGVAISLLFLAGIFAANIGNLRVLVTQAEDPVVPVLLLAFGLIITLTSVVMGSAIMMLKSGENPPSGGRRQRSFRMAAPLVPAPAARVVTVPKR